MLRHGLSLAEEILFLEGGSGLAFTYYVDSVNGNNSNNGKSPSSAFQTLAGLPSLSAGQSVGLANGSTWREQLTITANNILISAYTPSSGNSTAPIVRCDDIQANASFSKTGGLTNVYQIGITTNYTASEPGFVGVWEDDVRLTNVASSALCDATQGSYYVASHDAVSITVLVHASDSSDITANGKVYEMSTRVSAIYSFAAQYTTVIGIDARRNYSKGGSIKLGKFSTMKDCTCREGNSHSAYLRTGGAAINCTFNDAYHTAGTYFLVFNEDTPNNEGCLISGCAFISNPSGLAPTLNAPHNSHNNTSGSFGTIRIENCTYTGFRTNGAMFGQNHCSLVQVVNPVFTDCNYGITPVTTPSPSGVMTVTGGSFASAAGAQKRAIALTNATPITIDGFTMYLDAAPDTGLIAITAAAVATIQNCTFYNRLNSGSRIGIFCNNASADLTMSGNCHDGDYDWTQHYSFAVGASGMTWASDNNHFTPNFSMSIFGTGYTVLATYQTAQSQDAASDLVSCA